MAALNTLEPEHREILALRHLEGLSAAETAEVLGLGTASALGRHARALQRLRALLEDTPGLFESYTTGP